MTFFRRSRSRTDLRQAIHDDMEVARDEMRATVADAIAVAEGRLRKELDLRPEMSELVTRLETRWTGLDDREADVLHALTRVADSYELLARRIQEDRDERRLLIVAIERLAASLPAPTPPQALRPARERVLGGTIDAGRPAQLDLTEDEHTDAAPRRRTRSTTDAAPPRAD